MPFSGVYTVSGLVMLVFLASRAACGGGATEGPCPSVGRQQELASVPVEEDEEVVAR